MRNQYTEVWINVGAIICFTAFLIAAMHLVTLGYGSSQDTFLMLETWRQMALEGHYRPSRFQGSPIPEFVIGYASWFGGYVASNLVSLALSLGQLACLAAILRKFEASRREVILVIALTITNPHWIISAATSDDGSYGLTFFVIGLLLAVTRFPALAALALAAAGGSRISYAPLGLLVLGYFLYQDKAGFRDWLQATVVYAVVGGLLYLPAFIDSRLGLAFLHPSYPDQQGFLGLVARSVYKSFRLFGFLASLVVIVALATNVVFGNPRATGAKRLLLRGAWCVLIYSMLIYLRIPTEVSYILPCVIAIGVLLVFQVRSLVVVALVIVLQISYWFFAIEPLRIVYRDTGECGPVLATGAEFLPHLEDGPLLGEIAGVARGCGSRSTSSASPASTAR